MDDSERSEPRHTPTTTPASYCIAVSCFDDRQRAESFGRIVAGYVAYLGQHIDLSALDGVTIAGNYPQALAALDRGYETRTTLTASSDFAQGIAMTPAVLRDGMIKCHMVFNAAVLLPLEDTARAECSQAVYTLAHECAHVEVTKVFNACFPGVLLQPIVGDFWDGLRWRVIEACWNEYAASWLSAPFGHDPTCDYEETFLHVLRQAGEAAELAIQAYRYHADHGRIADEVYGIYGDLLKYAAYQMGNLAGHGRKLIDLPQSCAALSGHWFAPFHERLAVALDELLRGYGAWESKAVFEAIGDIADELVASRGLALRRHGNGYLRVDVPFSTCRAKGAA